MMEFLVNTTKITILQYSIGTWNVRSMNQGKLEVVKQEMARVNVDLLGISKLKWSGMGEFNSDEHYIYYCGQESLILGGGGQDSAKHPRKPRTMPLPTRIMRLQMPVMPWLRILALYFDQCILKGNLQDLPDSPMLKIPSFQCSGRGGVNPGGAGRSSAPGGVL